MAAEDKEVLRPVTLALAVLLWGCASRKPNLDRWQDRGTIRLGSEGKKRGLMKMSSEIDKPLGTPYRWGGTTAQGRDGSGLVCLVSQRSFEVRLPGSTAGLYRLGPPTDKDDLSYGDLAFFATSGTAVNYVGIHLSSADFVHVSKSSGTIISNLKQKYYRKRYKRAKRLLE